MIVRSLDVIFSKSKGIKEGKMPRKGTSKPRERGGAWIGTRTRHFRCRYRCPCVAGGIFLDTDEQRDVQKDESAIVVAAAAARKRHTAGGGVVSGHRAVRAERARRQPLEAARRFRPRPAPHPPPLQTELLRYPVQGGLRQDHIRQAGPDLRGLLQPVQGTTGPFALHEKLFYDGLFQGVSRNVTAHRRDGTGEGLDKTDTRGAPRRRGPNASQLTSSKVASKPY